MTPEQQQIGAQHALHVLMLYISEDEYCCGWYSGIEYSLWGKAQSPSIFGGRGPHPLPENLALALLSDLAGGWYWFPKWAHSEQFITRDDWMRHMAERRRQPEGEEG